MTRIKLTSPWISSSLKDSVFILSPPFITLLVILIFKDYFNSTTEMTTIGWVALVLLIDVAHVYSTLFRTYLNKTLLEKNKTLFLYTPILAWSGGVMLYSIGPLVFWRCIAYVAVFHFVRQQYGFLKIYSRNENHTRYSKYLDIIAIYASTVYPILYWHLTGPKNFDWFVKFDFYYLNFQTLADVLRYVYFFIIVLYFIKELYFIVLFKNINLAKNIIMIGTILSWYFGIVYFNSDLIFTALNIVSHGIPYMALVWLNESKVATTNTSFSFALFFKRFGWIPFLLFLFFLAFIEEGLWDSMVWKEHASVFKAFYLLPFWSDKTWLALLVPTLSLPQVTHYILDGYIWRISKKDLS